jgi:ssDNA-binding Zn-finger/Zn-ribbon topoisomerase 1
MFLHKAILWSLIFLSHVSFNNGGRIVGNTIIKNTNIAAYDNLYIATNLFNNPECKFELAPTNTKTTNNEQCVINNKNNLVYCEKDKELFLEENDFIKGKKLISISPGGLKGFYELGVLSFIKDNYNMENYIYSGASAGAWNALFMCYKSDSKKFVYTLMKELKVLRVKSIKDLEYVLKYNLLTKYNTSDFDLRRLFIGVTAIPNFRPTTNIFSDFNSLEDAINCCIASSHIPLITGGLTNRYHDMYTFDGGFSQYPYLNFTENVLHITPGMWKNNEIKITDNNKIMNRLASLNIIVELFAMRKNRNYMELFDNGYDDAKRNKRLLDEIFLNMSTTAITEDNNYPEF